MYVWSYIILQKIHAKYPQKIDREQALLNNIRAQLSLCKFSSEKQVKTKSSFDPFLC